MLVKRLLVVAAHPDDDILGCGGALLKYAKQGCTIRVMFLGEGSTSRFAYEQRASDEAIAAIEQRQMYAKAALQRLKIEDLSFYSAPCSRFDTVPLLELGQLIEAEIGDFLPDTIFTHAANDVNNDHCIAHQATLQATRPGAQNHVANLLCYEVLSSTEWRFTQTFQPNVFVDIADEIEEKIEALACYKSEIRSYPFPRSPEGILTLSKMRGMQVGLLHAEAFELVRRIES